MQVTCTGANCAITNPDNIKVGTRNFFTVDFSFSSEWTGKDKRAIFKNGVISKIVTLTSASCILPIEVTNVSGDLYIGLEGIIEGTNVVVITTNYAFACTIEEGVPLSIIESLI